jgi:succinyl-CoA synthetase beta subunit
MHKTEIGGVRLDVPADAAAVRAAYEAVTAAAAATGAAVEGVLVSPMRRGGTEVLAGVVRDRHWGLLLAVAMGGVFVEVLRESALAPLPVTAEQARRMLEGLRGHAVLRGARGGEPADLGALASVIARLGDLALALSDDLESLEVNPLLVAGQTVEALDAVVTWSRK